jgi:site-specific recombinase XerC
MKAYRQDFDVIATFVAGADTTDLARMSLADITTESMRTAFAQHAETHEAATIQRCWSTWNVLCTFLYTSELIVANPMPLVGRPKAPKTLPKALPTGSVAALLGTLNTDSQPRRRSDWIERDRALILTALLAGLRADELLRANVGDLRRSRRRRGPQFHCGEDVNLTAVEVSQRARKTQGRCVNRVLAPYWWSARIRNVRYSPGPAAYGPVVSSVVIMSGSSHSGMVTCDFGHWRCRLA